MKRYLMTPGPTPVAPETQLAMATPIIHHRAPQFMDILGEVREGLKYLFQTRQEVLIFAATGTGAMEGAVANTLSAGDTALVVAGGKEPQAAEAAEEKADGLLRAGLDQAGESPSALARKVAHATGLARETVYRRLLALREARQADGEQTRTEEVEPSEAIDSVEPILRCELTVGNSLGLHARVAARIAETVQRFDSQVVLGKDGLEADGGSVLSILALDAPQGSRLSVLAKGAQAQAAVDALRALFASDFGES